MIPNTNLRQVSTNGVQQGTGFEISADDSPFIMSILRDNIYSDKVLAVLREYSANAWDAHRMAGKGAIPIRVTLPTSINPVLSIRDFGPGMSREEVFDVYTKYGRSTKRTTEDAVGMMGIGSKSAFAYSDSFTITSWNGGTKAIYNAVLDASERGVLNLLHEEPCGDETGLEIQVPVHQKDIYEFTNKARNLFQYFNPRPEINVDLPAVEADAKLKNGMLSANDPGTWIAVMGCIPYRVDIEQLREMADFDYSTFEEVGGALYFNIGEVQINASREELRYTDNTKNKLVEKFNALVDEFVQTTLDDIENGDYTPWEKRLRAQVLHKLHLPVPDDVEELFAVYVSLKDLASNSEKGIPNAFTLQRGRNFVTTISIDERVVLYMQDDKRALSGFHLAEHSYVVKPAAKTSLEAARKALDAMLEKYGLTGVAIENLSSRPWSQPTRGWSGKKVNVKHRVKAFKLDPTARFYKPYSNAWLPEAEREASDDDVFVILSNFKASYNFYNCYERDVELAKVFGKTMPEVYGYKTTEAKPIVESKVQGREYLKWRKEFHESILTDENKRLISLKLWADVATDRYYYTGYGYGSNITDKTVAQLSMALGSNHPIVSYAHRAVSSAAELKTRGISDDVIGWLTQVADVEMRNATSKDIQNEREAIESRYPMLKLGEVGIARLWNDRDQATCLDYVKLVDKNNNEEK